MNTAAEALLEEVAEAIYEGTHEPGEWAGEEDTVKLVYRHQARHALRPVRAAIEAEWKRSYLAEFALPRSVLDVVYAEAARDA